MNEESLIRRMLARFDRSPGQLNQPFASDAELFVWGGQVWGISTDAFDSEDAFGPASPERIGWNVAVATISDLFAAGVSPQFFVQAVTVPKTDSGSFVGGLSTGVSAALREAGCFLLGGDLSRDEEWRYTGTALGTAREGVPLTRILRTPESYDLWATGNFGDANAAALSGTAAPAFELRMVQAEMLRRIGAAAIDSSDGFIKSVWLMSQLNPGFRWEIDLPQVPIDRTSRNIAMHAGIPVEALLVGGAGEYELIFAVPAGTQVDAPETVKIGQVSPGRGLWLRTHAGNCELCTAPPCPREYGDRKDYIAAVLRYVEGWR